MSTAAFPQSTSERREASAAGRAPSSTSAPAASNMSSPILRPDAAPLIDPVLDYDEKSGSVATASADALLRLRAGRGLTVEWILDTHPHADHFSAAGYLKDKTGREDGHRRARSSTSSGSGRRSTISTVSRRMARNGTGCSPMATLSGSASMDVRVALLPGPYPGIDHLCGRRRGVHSRYALHAGFRNGPLRLSRRQMREPCGARIQRILALPDETRLFSGHDYMPGGRAPAWESTVAGQKAQQRPPRTGARRG